MQESAILQAAFNRWAEYFSASFRIPTQLNGFIESFNGKLRDECLNLNWFHNLQEAREKIGRWKDEYNTIRTHSALGQKTPAEYAKIF